MGVVPAQDPGPGKAKTKIDESNTHTDKPTKARNSNLVEVRVHQIIWSHLRQKDGTTGVCVGEVTCTKDGCTMHEDEGRKDVIDVL
jgi:hypothetical protein